MAELIITDHAWQRWQERIDPEITVDRIARYVSTSRVLDEKKAAEAGLKFRDNQIYLRRGRIVMVLAAMAEQVFCMLTVINVKKSRKIRKKKIAEETSG